MNHFALAPLSLCLSKAGLSAGTTTTITTTATVVYAIGGIAYSKGAITNGATPTTDAVTGAAFLPVSANQGCTFLFGLDASGNVKVSQGGLQALDATGNFIVSPAVPTLPDGVTAFGYLVFKGGATLSGTWTFGSSNLSGVTGVTFSFKDLITLPGRPQVA